MSYDDYFPTDFAKEIGRKERLYPIKDLYEYDGEKQKKMNARHMRLKQFQQICALGTYEEAIVIYKNIKLDKDQENVLRFIAESTPLQMQGMTIQSMIDVIQNRPTHKDYAKILDLMMEVTGKKGATESGAGASFEALVINTTKRKLEEEE